MKTIVYGICGIGRGHTFRQLPIIDVLAQQATIMLFGYGESYRFYREHFAQHDNVQLAEVAVPFYAGNRSGLDFAATAEHPANQGRDFVQINAAAMARAAQLVGRPDLVISDYEPVSAQYAYAMKAPLVTIDQQSKFLAGELPAELAGETYLDEVMRLRMFFPQAAARLACSFFAVAPRAAAAEAVTMFGPVIRPAVLDLKRTVGQGRPLIIVYITGQQAFRQPLTELVSIARQVPAADIHIFHPQGDGRRAGHVTVFPYDNSRFLDSLARCSGLVSTAGHTLLSEALYLGIPVYAMPLALYEQLLNAEMVQRGGFGLVAATLTAERLAAFIKQLPRYRQAIATDRDVLIREPGQTGILRYLQAEFGLPS